MKLLLSYNKQTYDYNQIISLENLVQFCKQGFKDLPQNFTFVYQSAEGDLTYIESDTDLIGLKYINFNSKDSVTKLSILRSSAIDEFYIEKDIKTDNIVKRNIEQLEENIFVKVENEDHNRAVCQYLIETYDKVSIQIASIKSDSIYLEVREYLTMLYNKCSNRDTKVQTKHLLALQKPKIMKIVSFSPNKPAISLSQKSIQKIVSEKVLQLMPSLVNQIYAKIQSKVGSKCPNCHKQEIQLDQTIDKEIAYRVSLICIEDENPEQR